MNTKKLTEAQVKEFEDKLREEARAKHEQRKQEIQRGKEILKYV